MQRKQWKKKRRRTKEEKKASEWKREVKIERDLRRKKKSGKAAETTCRKAEGKSRLTMSMHATQDREKDEERKKSLNRSTAAEHTIASNTPTLERQTRERP